MTSNKSEFSGSAPDIMAEFSKLTRASTAHMNKLRMTTIYTDGAVSAKYKVLAAALWSVSARCEPCVKYYAREARQRGVTDGEFAEFLAVATGMGGCVGETWAIKAFEAFKGFQESESGTDSSDSCETDCQCA